jgi:hypothetical protein
LSINPATTYSIALGADLGADLGATLGVALVAALVAALGAALVDDVFIGLFFLRKFWVQL